ncbi:MAG: hypothetical protein ABNO52_00620 [Candidatus Shikimatogenerans sp. Tser]|uniref:DNA-directed RNA polymerase n=1 Tax=Candidatus Shikimatogenerans sp. Tser TaxID=3158568 RepID=A0AAU7QQ74_9FLAO
MNKFIKLNNKSYLKCKNLLFIQINEFKKFLTLSFKNRKKVKLYHLLKNFFPVYNNKNTIIINYIDYFINKPIYSIKKCLLNNLTYEVDIKILLHIYSQKHNINKYKIVYLTKCPLMTKYGSFIFNGSERVVVSQLYRPNNIFFYKKPYKNYKYYSVKIIPKRGIWIDMYINEYKIFYFIIDKKKKIYITTFLRFLGYKNNKDILKLFKIIKKKKITKIKKKKIIIYDNINNKLLFINSKKKININKKFVYLINDNKYKKYFPIINTLLKEKIFDYKKIINTLYNT